MAVTSSGEITLNEIHIEAGGTTATQAALNDADIRGLIGKASLAQNAMNEYYGASSADTETSFTGGTSGNGEEAGYSTDGSYGSYSDRTFDDTSSGSTRTVYDIFRYSETDGSKQTTFFIELHLDGSATTSSFSNMILSTGTLTESSATSRAVTDGSHKKWIWNLGIDAGSISGGITTSGTFDVDWS